MWQSFRNVVRFLVLCYYCMCLWKNFENWSVTESYYVRSLVAYFFGHPVEIYMQENEKYRTVQSDSQSHLMLLCMNQTRPGPRQLLRKKNRVSDSWSWGQHVETWLYVSVDMMTWEGVMTFCMFYFNSAMFKVSVCVHEMPWVLLVTWQEYLTKWASCLKNCFDGLWEFLSKLQDSQLNLKHGFCAVCAHVGCSRQQRQAVNWSRLSRDSVRIKTTTEGIGSSSPLTVWLCTSHQSPNSKCRPSKNM